MKKIAVMGSGGFAREVAFLIEEINKQNQEWELLGFIDRNTEIGSPCGKYKVFQPDDWLGTVDFELHVVIGIGIPSLLTRIKSDIPSKSNIRFPNLVHPNVVGDWERINMGQGNIVTAGNIFTTDIEIGSFNIFNLDCTIGHDAVIGNFNVINPSANISGGVKISDKCLVGTGSQLLQGIGIVSGTTVGAGAVVTKNLTEPGVYVGTPAKKLESRQH